MRFTTAAAFVAASGLVCSAVADTPAHLVPFIGTEVSLSAPELSRLGYANVAEDFWWNVARASCVHMPAVDGLFVAAETQQPQACGISPTRKIGSGAGCPLDLADGERALFPDCRNIMAGR